METNQQTINNDEPEVKSKTGRTHKLMYDVNQWPPIPISIAVACQHLICCIGATVTMTYTVSDVVCVSSNDPIRSSIFCSSLFMVGIATVFQSLLGVRLPVFQGPSFTFLPPLIAMKTTGLWTCPSPNQDININGSIFQNGTANYVDEITKYQRINELQGSLMLASLLEVFIGATGLIGSLLYFIGPITISVTIFLLGYSLYVVPINYSNTYWPVAIVSAMLMIIFGVYLAHVKVRLPRCLRRKNKPGKGYSLFDVFAILISITITWILCWVLTRTGVFPDDPTDPAYRARTDTRLSLIKNTPWFFFPYPGQFGAPQFNLTLFIGFLSVIMSSAMESIGDYFAIGKTCNAFPPPPHAVNRGILIEGIMSILSASLGTGHATTSYTTNASIVAITKVGSRYVLALSGAMGMVLAIFGKLGAVMTSMPDPIIGGFILVSIGIVLSLGISGLRNVDMTSNRNISVVGLSIFIPIIGSEWLNRYPDKIKTGSAELDKVIRIVLGFPMISGVIVAMVMDNTVKGTRKERGFMSPESLSGRHHSIVEGCDITRMHLFNIPYIDKFCRHSKLLRYLPFIQKLDYNIVDHSV